MITIKETGTIAKINFETARNGATIAKVLIMAGYSAEPENRTKLLIEFYGKAAPQVKKLTAGNDVFFVATIRTNETQDGKVFTNLGGLQICKISEAHDMKEGEKVTEAKPSLTPLVQKVKSYFIENEGSINSELYNQFIGNISVITDERAKKALSLAEEEVNALPF